jgi:hypothetical protein
MRRTLLVALSLLLVGLVAAPAPAQAWHVVEVRGRKLDTFSHLGNPALGQAACAVQGQMVDTGSFDGLADGLQARAACLETRGVTRFRIYGVRLEVLVDGTWRLLARGPEVVSTGSTAFAVTTTQVPGWCDSPVLIRRYRVVAVEATRWSLDDTVGTRRHVSAEFQERPVVNDPSCTG